MKTVTLFRTGLFLVALFAFADPALAKDKKKKWDDRYDRDDDDRRRAVVVIRERPVVQYYRAPVYRRSYYPDYRPNSLGADVQEALARRGYYHGPIDGDIGPGSRSAIRAYQYEHGLPATGRIDSWLLRSLRL